MRALAYILRPQDMIHYSNCYTPHISMHISGIVLTTRVAMPLSPAAMVPLPALQFLSFCTCTSVILTQTPSLALRVAKPNREMKAEIILNYFAWRSGLRNGRFICCPQHCLLRCFQSRSPHAFLYGNAYNESFVIGEIHERSESLASSLLSLG